MKREVTAEVVYAGYGEVNGFDRVQALVSRGYYITHVTNIKDYYVLYTLEREIDESV